MANYLHIPVARKFKNCKLHSSFQDIICRADLAEMQLISKHSEGVSFLLYIIDIYGKYASPSYVESQEQY